MYFPHADPDLIRELKEKYADDPDKLAFLEAFMRDGTTGNGESLPERDPVFMLDLLRILRSNNVREKDQWGT